MEQDLESRRKELADKADPLFCFNENAGPAKLVVNNFAASFVPVFQQNRVLADTEDPPIKGGRSSEKGFSVRHGESLL